MVTLSKAARGSWTGNTGWLTYHCQPQLGTLTLLVTPCCTPQPVVLCFVTIPQPVSDPWNWGTCVPKLSGLSAMSKYHSTCATREISSFNVGQTFCAWHMTGCFPVLCLSNCPTAYLPLNAMSGCWVQCCTVYQAVNYWAEATSS